MKSDSPSLETLFIAAIEKNSMEAMLAYVDQEAGGNIELAGKVKQLIAAHHKAATNFMESPAEGVASELGNVAQTVGLNEEAMEAGLSQAFDEKTALVLGGTGHSVLKSLSRRAGKPLNVTLKDSPEENLKAHKANSTEIPNTDSDSRYQLHGEIARGGMGAVLKGRDVDLGRDLAVKVLLDKHRDNPELLERFVEEAQIGGQLQHPGIVPVYELGEFKDQRPFFTMKLVKGETLAAILAKRKSVEDDLPKLIGIFEQVCQTMAYAHSKGVIHRDLKPANIMVGAFGEVQVMDWGLSKVLEAGGVADEQKSRDREVSVIQTKRSVGSSTGGLGSETVGGSIMGTPAYMPPEQALGETNRLDARSDVFSLGAVLAEILTGKPVYAADEFDDLVSMARRGKVNECHSRLDASNAPSELIDICKKALEPEQIDRQHDASALASEITAYLEGVQEKLKETELARAQAETRSEEETKRKRLYMGLAGLTCAALLVTSLLAVLLKNSSDVARAAKAAADKSAVKANLESKNARKAEVDAKAAAERETRERMRSHILRLAAKSRQLRETARSRSILLATEAIRIAKENDLGPIPEVHSALLEATIDVSGTPLPKGKMWFTRSKSRALSNRDGKLELWDFKNEKMEPTGFEHSLEQGWNVIRFNWDGTKIAIRNQHASGTLLLTLDDTASVQVDAKRIPGYLMALSLDASTVVTSLDRQLLLWREPFSTSDEDSSEHLGEHVLHSKSELSSDNRWFFQHTGTAVQLWDLKLKKEYRIPVENNIGKTVGFSPDGTWLYLGGEEGKQDRLFDLTTVDPSDKPQRLLGSAISYKDFGQFFFSADRSWLAVGASESEIQLYRFDGREASVRCVLKGLEKFGPIHGDLFSPNSRFLTTVEGPNVRMWDLSDIDRVEMQRTVLSEAEQIVPLWEAKEFGEKHSRLFVCANDELPHTVNFSSDSRWMSVWTYANESRLWDLHDPLLSRTRLETRSQPYSVKFSNTNQHLAIGDVDGSAKVYELEDGLPFGEPTKINGDHEGSVVVDFSGDGRFLMTRHGHVDSSVIQIWNMRDLDSPLYTLSGITRPIDEAMISRNGRFVIADLVAQGTADTEFYCWDLQSNQRDTPQVLDGHTARLWMWEFGESEEELFTGGEDGTLLRWDLSQEEPKATTVLETSEVVWATRKTEDGWRVASNSDSQGHLWDLDESFGLRDSSIYKNTIGNTWQLRLSPTGRWYAAGNSVWNPTTQRCVAAHAHKQNYTTASKFSADGRYFATMSVALPSSIIVSDLQTQKTMRIAGKNGRAAQHAIDFSPDGRWLATAFRDRETNVSLFALDENTAVERAKQLVGRSLTDQERMEFQIPE